MGTMVNDEMAVENCFVDYFADMFSSRGVQDLGIVFEVVSSRLTDVSIANLDHPFVAEDTVMTIKHMHPYKATGLDGMNPSFFQNDSIRFFVLTVQFMKHLKHVYMNNKKTLNPRLSFI